MATIEPIVDDEMPDDVPSIGEVKLLRADIEARCRSASLTIEDLEGLEEGDLACKVALPCGREKRWIYCYDSDDYRRLLSIPFEEYTFLTGLEAVCLYAKREIEAIVRPLGNLTTRFVNLKLFKSQPDEFRDESGKASIVLESSIGDSSTKISIGPASRELKILSGFPERVHLSLKVQREGLSQHDQSLQYLRRIADSLFFQIDLLADLPLSLARDRRSTGRRRAKKRGSELPIIAFPANEYDSAPISLYWYAKSAVGMPLLQFLAFYQVIEFYYPTYSQAEARRKLKAILKDPTFRGNRDADIGRVLSAIQITRSGGYGDERSQLRATLMECVDADALREFLIADTERTEFLSSKTKGLSDHKLPIATPNIDLRGNVADRIYEIRCKIVHNKTDSRTGELELLLPFSKEADQLYFDIELAQYVAQQVLIAASTPFQS